MMMAAYFLTPIYTSSEKRQPIIDGIKGPLDAAFRSPLMKALDSTGGPSSSCEMIILRNNSHGGIIRVCMGIFTTALRNKKIRQILNKNTSPYFHSVSLVI